MNKVVSYNYFPRFYFLFPTFYKKKYWNEVDNFKECPSKPTPFVMEKNEFMLF